MNEAQLKDICRERYWIDTAEHEEAVFSIPCAELAAPAGMRRLLEAYGTHIRALDVQVPAAYFCGSLAPLGVALQTAVSAANRSFDFSPEHMTVDIRYLDGKYPIVAFRLHHWQTDEAPASPADRKLWLESVYTAFYGRLIRPLIEAAAAASASPIGSLWGQLPSKYNYYMNVWKSGLEAGETEIGQRIDADYDALLRLPPTVFGRTRHPLSVRIKEIASLTEPGGTTAMKSACCLYYRTEGGQYCYACPKLKEEERASRRAAYEAAQRVEA